MIQAIPRNPLEVSVDSMTRFRVKRLKEAFNGLLQNIRVKMDFKNILNNEDQAFINLIHVQELLVSKHLDITKI